MLALKFVHIFLLILFFIASWCNHLFSQASSTDSSDSAVKNTLRIYASAAGDQAPYYNGIQYRRYPNFIHYGHPFFVADSLMNGSVTYDNVTFENVMLQYDEVNDELITADVQGNNLVQLLKQNISGFTIGPHHFINISPAYTLAGYYRVLYNGKSQIIVKESKSIQVKPGRVTEETERTVYSTTDYYMKTAKGYEKFNRLNSFLSLFDKQRKQVAGFIRDKKLKFRTDRENLYYQAASFYDQLTD